MHNLSWSCFFEQRVSNLIHISFRNFPFSVNCPIYWGMMSNHLYWCSMMILWSLKLFKGLYFRLNMSWCIFSVEFCECHGFFLSVSYRVMMGNLNRILNCIWRFKITIQKICEIRSIIFFVILNLGWSFLQKGCWHSGNLIQKFWSYTFWYSLKLSEKCRWAGCICIHFLVFI